MGNMAEEILNSGINNIKIADNNADGNASEAAVRPQTSQDDNGDHLKWGYPLNSLYKLGLKFYKDNEGKAINLSYQNKLRLVACSQQVSHGPYNADNQPPLGVLDVIGRDRRDAWQLLGEMTKETAMINFIDLLDTSSPAFKPFVEAQKADEEMKKQQAILEELKRQQDEANAILHKEELKREEEERQAAEERKRQIQDALNAQTFHQFKDYAEQQYPGNPEQQAVLVRQLQEQHYHQYIQQLLQQQHQAVQTNTTYSDNNSILVADKSEQVEPITDVLENSEDEQDDGVPTISAPSMWTRPEIFEFKDSIRNEGSESIIKVGRGETVTVRVPTHDEGTCLFWEFATDSYDIGFGVYFEWTKSETNQVSVHIQDSDDDEDLLDEEEFDEEDLSELETSGGDVETGGRVQAKLLADKPLVSAIVPIYRRDCQSEVYAGSHTYPGQGVYLLKFDNSYSLWRSKTLYYRVYYKR